MLKFLSFACVAVSLGALASTAVAAADSRHGMYLSLTGGYSGVSGDAKITDVQIEDESFPDLSVSLDNGWVADASVGAYLGMFRIEGEFAYRSNTSNGVSVDPGYTATADLDNVLSLMFNAYIDIPIVDRLSAYVGGGIGVATYQVDIDYSKFNVDGSIDGTLANFAYQGMVGLTYDITPRLHLSGGARVFSTVQSSFDDNQFQGKWNLPLFYSFEANLRFDL